MTSPASSRSGTLEKKRKPQRPSWDEYFMQVANVVKSRSTCLSSAKGAVLVSGRQIVSTGYNGTPAGTRHCDEGGCARCLAVKEGRLKSGAGARKLLLLPQRGERHRPGCEERNPDLRMHPLLHPLPCTFCSKMIINAGIKKVVASSAYPDQLGVRLMKEAGLQLVIL